MPPASCMAATVQMTGMMMPMTDQGTSLVAVVCRPVATRMTTPAPPASPIPIPPNLAPMTMKRRAMSRWNQIMRGSQGVGVLGAGSRRGLCGESNSVLV